MGVPPAAPPGSWGDFCTLVSKENRNFHTVYYTFINCVKVLFFFVIFKNKVFSAVTPLLDMFLSARSSKSIPPAAQQVSFPCSARTKLRSRGLRNRDGTAREPPLQMLDWGHLVTHGHLRPLALTDLAGGSQGRLTPFLMPFTAPARLRTHVGPQCFSSRSASMKGRSWFSANLQGEPGVDSHEDSDCQYRESLEKIHSAPFRVTAPTNSNY